MNKQEFLTYSGLQVQTLDLWLEQRWLIPEETSVGIQFSDIDVARARLIHDLKSDLGANDEGIDVILHLWISSMGCATRSRNCKRIFRSVRFRRTAAPNAEIGPAS